jgi:hypothetical protein
MKPGSRTDTDVPSPPEEIGEVAAFDCACEVFIDTRGDRVSYRLVLEPFDLGAGANQ